MQVLHVKRALYGKQEQNMFIPSKDGHKLLNFIKISLTPITYVTQYMQGTYQNQLLTSHADRHTKIQSL